MIEPLLVAVDAPLAAGDTALTYTWTVPLSAGTAVLVPLGARLTVGYVLGPAPLGERALRSIITPLVDIPRLPPDLISLAQWVAGQYVCSTGEALNAMLPPGLMAGLRLRVSGGTGKGARVRSGPRGQDLRAVQKMLGRGAVAALQRGLEASEITLSVVLPSARLPEGPASPRFRLRVHPTLWPPATGKPRRLLLASRLRDGPYLAAVSETLRREGQALLLFPSVARAERFATRAAEVLRVPVVLLHGELPADERMARWLAVREGAAPIVVGTRAAVFAPASRLGLIVVDDDADAGHKEERVPRYHVREIARRRASKADLVLGGDVPSLEAYAGGDANAGRLEVVGLEVGGDGPAPKVAVVDLRRPAARAGREQVASRDQPEPTPVLATPLMDALRETVRSGGRAALLVPRRGFAGYLFCRECGHVPRCPRCEIPLVFGLSPRGLHCRYCRDRFAAPAVCARCGGITLESRAAGTQRVAQIVRRTLGVSTHTLDREAARTPQAVSSVLRRFRDDGGVLVATVLLLHVPEPPALDLAGVVLADAAFHHPDFRAAEHGLRTLWGLRAMTRGWLILQTFAPEHPAILALRRGDLRSFYRRELRTRKLFHYPPAGEMLTVDITGTPEAARSVGASLARALVEAPAGLPETSAGPSPDGAGETDVSPTAETESAIEVLGPVPDRSPRKRWQLMVRSAATVPRGPIVDHARRLPSGVRIAVDVDP